MPRRLLIVTTIPQTLKAFLFPFARYFRTRGWEVDALASGAGSCAGCVAAFDRVWDVIWSRNPLDWRNILKAPGRVREIVERGRYDIVHVHTPIASVVTRFALREMRRSGRPKLIYTAHGFHFHPGGSWLRNTLFQSIERLSARWTDYLVVMNEDDEQMARALRLVPPDRLCYMPGIGVDTTALAPSGVPAEDVRRIRGELGLPDGSGLFSMVAEFIPRKRHVDAIDAFARLGRRDVHLAFAGSGPQVPAIKRRAVELGIGDRVSFLGFRSDVAAIMRASAATVLTSGQEGLPRSVMESLSLGVPVIASNIRGVRDLLRDGCGIMVDVGDTSGYARAMATMLEHPVTAAAMGERGRRKMAAVHDIHRVVALHEELYRSALDDRTAELLVA